MKNVPQDLPVLKNPPLPTQTLADQVFQGSFSLTTMPVRARIVEEFSAADPWHQGVPAQWTLEVFRMVNIKALPMYTNGKAKVRQNEAGGRTGGGEVLGLRNAAENRLRILPRALAQLWQQGKVPTRELPRLAAMKEPQLSTRDYLAVSVPKTVLYVFLLPALLFLLIAGADWFLNRRSPVDMTPARWLSKPVTSTGSVSVHEPLAIDGKLPIATVNVPGYIQDGTATGNVLVWYKAPEGERLALIGPLGAQSLLQYGATYVSLEGPVIETKDLHLPAQVLEGIAAQTTNLQSKYIVCHDWRWVMQQSPLGGVPQLWLGSAGFLLLLWGLFFLRQMRQNQRLAAVRQDFLRAI